MTILCSVKKTMAILAVAALVLCGASVMAVAVPSDVDGNGAVSTADVRLVLLGILDKSLLTEEQYRSADINGDGRLTSADARHLLLVTLDEEGEPIVTSATSVVTTLPDPTTVHSTTFTMPETTTTSGWDCISTTTVTTTDVSTTVTYPPTTRPYAEPVVFTLYTDEEFVRAGKPFDLHFDVSGQHSVIGYQFAIYYDPEDVTPQRVSEEESNPYAHGLNTTFYNENAQWNFTLERDGLLKGSFVTTALTGKTDETRLFSLTFFLDELAEHSTEIHLYAWPVLCNADGLEYEPAVHVDGGFVKIASSTTRPKTTTEGTTDPTWPTTTVTVWEDGTTSTVPDCVSTPAPTTVTTLPYGEWVDFTVSTDEEYVRAGRTFDLHIDISENHSVVGFQLALDYDPYALTLQQVSEDDNNPYAHGLNAAVFDDQAQWSFTLEREGLLKGSYVSTADTGQTDASRLFTLTFYLEETAEDWTEVALNVWPILSSVGGFEYEPSVSVAGGLVKIASSSTRPKTTTETTTTTTTTTWVLTGPDGTAPTTWPTTTETTYVWTTTTYPPTTTTWVLTGPDGTAPTTYPPTTMP